MKWILITLPLLLLVGCENSTTGGDDQITPPSGITLKGAIPKQRALPTVTHVSAIPVTENYSASYIVKNLTPIVVLEDGSFTIEGIETDIVVVLLDMSGSSTKVVDLVSLKQSDEDLLLIPLENVADQELNLGTLDLSGATALSSLVPQEFLDSLSSSEIADIATLDDIYKNIENHINNSSKAVDGSAKEEQVFYLKPEIAIRNSIKDLYAGVSSSTLFTNAAIDYNLLQFSTLPIEIPVTEIPSNFAIQSPSGALYTCPALSAQEGVVQEGDDLFVRRYMGSESGANFMIEYLWATAAEAESEAATHTGNVNFFNLDSHNAYWIPEQGKWTYLWKGQTYGTFDVAFARPFDSQNRFEGYFPVPTIQSSDGKLTSVSLIWYKQSNGIVSAVSDLSIAEKLITSIEIEVSAQKFNGQKFEESAMHINESTLSGATLSEDVYLVDQSLINEEDDVTNTTSLEDGKKYADALWVMYELGNELKFSFVWQLHISQD